VTCFPSQTPRRHATAQSFAAGIAGCLSLPLPAALFMDNRSMLPGTPAGSSSRNRHLATPFNSPETTARLRIAIPRSKIPTCCFDTLPFVHRARSDSNSPARPSSPWLARDHRRNPVARLPPGTPSLSSDLHSPLGPFGPFRIKAFNPILSREVRFPIAPDCSSLPGFQTILLASMPDHRSKLAPRSVACCSSDLLEPQSSCTGRCVAVK